LHGALIGYIGADPYQGHWGDGSFFPQSTGYLYVGASDQFSSDKSGKLWLGMNDSAATGFNGAFDNSGSVTAQISVTPVPEPSSFALILIAAAALSRGLKMARRL
jgi:hypothetical protein